jgi:uncharacterized 2Fe-2S/4Fe-4S cluster protein (DUF4445 family)
LFGTGFQGSDFDSHCLQRNEAAILDRPPSEIRKTFTIDLQPVGRRAEIPPDQTLLAAAQSVGVELQSVCGGVGTCGHCKVRLVAGEFSPVTAEEREGLGAESIAAGYRLACRTIPRTNVTLDVPPESLTAAQRVQIEGQQSEIAPDPLVVPRDFEFDPESFCDLGTDPSRWAVAVKMLMNDAPGVVTIASVVKPEDLTISPSLVAGLAEQLRQQEWRARLAIRKDAGGQHVVAILPPASRLCGIAFDVGTTKIAAYLVDLATGKTLAQSGAMNPQIAYGEDVISRISYADRNDDCRKRLQSQLIKSLNRLVLELGAASGVSREQILELVVAGNTAMHHFFAGFPVWQLGTAPYLPATTAPLHLPARELGLEVASGACVYTPPNIAGYVGGDHVAMLLATGMANKQWPTLAIDIGTNTELTVGINGRLLTCSCASGPAFEGAHIKQGMRAAPGAIERVLFDRGVFRCYSIDRLPPAGICGSGILDALAALLDATVLDKRGNFQRNAMGVRFRDRYGEFVLAEADKRGQGSEVVVTRQDVSEIQFAKAAVRAAIEVLLDESGISAAALQEFLIAGAFGSYLDIRSAVRIGLFPGISLHRFVQVGNAAGSGARQMLVSAERRRAGEDLARRIEYIELTNHPRFHEKFVSALSF